MLAASVSQVGDQAILFGQPQPNLNLTFGEGIFAVPEPSTFPLMGIAVVCVTGYGHRRASRAELILGSAPVDRTEGLESERTMIRARREGPTRFSGLSLTAGIIAFTELNPTDFKPTRNALARRLLT